MNDTNDNITIVSNDTHNFTTSRDNQDSTELTEALQLQARINDIQVFLCPILLVVGIFGNTFIALTVSHPQFRDMTIRYFLLALALSDSLAILTNPFNQNFMKTIGERDPRALSNFGCKLFFVVYRTGKLTASWFIVGIAVERLFAVVFPQYMKTALQRRNVLIAIAIVYISMTTSNAFWSFSTAISEDNICLSDIVPPGGFIRHKVHIILAASLYTFCPFVVLICITPPIIARLLYVQSKRRSLMQRESSTTDTSRISLMLIVVILSWVVWITPITVVLIHTLWTDEPIFGSTKKELIILQATAQFFEQINHSCNFITYVLFSARFRERFLQMISIPFICCRRSAQGSSGIPQTSDTEASNSKLDST